MKLISIITLLFAIVLTTFAGPTTNREEYRGDALLTKAQQAEYTERLNKGAEYFDAGKYELAETEYNTILKFAPKKALVHFNLGLTKYKQGNFPEAIKHFDTVVKMRSYYVGAAFYYKAISQMNLDQNDEATKTAKRYTQARFFYKPSQELIKTIKTGSDEYYENAVKATADENYELCLLEMDESVLTDTRKGKELVTKCALALKSGEPVFETAAPKTLPPYYHNLYLDMHVSQTDNIYQENINQIKKMTYFAEFGGQFLIRNYIDTGIGFFYNHFNAIDLARFKDETFNVHVPFYFRSGKNRVSAQVFYNLSKYEGADSYSDAGLGLNYSYNEEKYQLGLYGSTLKRTSLNTAFDYKAGTNNSVRFVASRFINQLTVSAIAGYEQVFSGDQPWGATVLPYANKTSRLGLNLSYDFNKISILNLRSAYAVKDYANRLAPNFTDRDDKTTSVTLAYQHVFSNKVRAYLQQTMQKNTSNFAIPAELIDRNYTENITTLGLSLQSF